MTTIAAIRAAVARALAPKPQLWCQVCFRSVGDANPVYARVGRIITGCATCTSERRRR